MAEKSWRGGVGCSVCRRKITSLPSSRISSTVAIDRSRGLIKSATKLMRVGWPSCRGEMVQWTLRVERSWFLRKKKSQVDR